MKKRKYLAFGLSVILALSLVSCSRQQVEQEPQEQRQEIQQVAEPVNLEAPAPPVETKPEAEPEDMEPVDVQTDEVEDNETAPVEEEQPIDPFTEANETVWATGTVNIRASWSADSSKLGSLGAGNSVTRTGIGKDDADGWSRVTLSDGSTAYISNKYLSTTKPVQQSQSGQSTNSAQQQTQPASSGGKGDFVPGPGYNRGSVDVSDFVPITGTEGPSILTGEEVIEGWRGIQ